MSILLVFKIRKLKLKKKGWNYNLETITKYDRDRLERVGLIKYKITGVTGSNVQDPNITICGRGQSSRAKTIYITEDVETMRFLGRWEKGNVQKITKKQFDKLTVGNFINEKTTQQYDTYIPKAKCYISYNGDIYIIKESAMMIFLDIWKDKYKKKR